MKMPGGGSHKTAPGQGTDDSELGTAAMLGLIDQNVGNYVDGNTEVALNMDKVCSRYKDWYDSDPFDCGSTTRGALGALTRHWRELSDNWELIIRESAARDIYKVSEAVNKASKSNGSMMKICPLAVWAADIIREDTEENLAHFNKIIHYDSRVIHFEALTGCVIFLYSATIAYLINNCKDEKRAGAALKFAVKLANSEPYVNITADDGKASAAIWIDEAIKLWEDAKADDRYIFNPHKEPKPKEKYTCTEAIGFVKHAFILSFYFLAKAADEDEDGNLTYSLEGPDAKQFWSETVKEVISLGGDTDTNGCIVGGFIGAYVGVHCIDDLLLQKYFTYNNPEVDENGPKGKKRPEWLNMGRNSVDSIFWLLILRFKANENNKAKVPIVWDPPVLIGEHE